MEDSDRNKEEEYSTILSDFIACTGISDEGQAIRYLENVNWDLISAINLVMPQNSQRLPSESASVPDVEMISSFSGGIPTTYTNPNPSIITIAPDEEMPHASSSSSSNHRKSSRIINFKVSYNNNTYTISLPENKTIYDLKLEVASKTCLPPCRQLFKGWPNTDFQVIYNDRFTFSTLNLPDVVDLIVDSRASLDIPTFLPSTNGHSNNLKKKKSEHSEGSKLYRLNIADLTNGREYHLKYGGNTKVKDIKEEIATLTKIPISLQQWTGWSDQDDSDSDASTSTSIRRKQDERDALPLYQSGITYPNHDFTVEQAPNSSSLTTHDSNKSIIDIADTDSSVDEYEDASESFTGEDSSIDTYPEISRRKLQSLIPDNVDDETTGTIHFIEEFENRYGDQRPQFYPGTLDDAIKEACFKPAKERKILAVYLHHDSSVLTNVFCSQLLCFESVLQFLTQNCVVWGWDLTYKSNQAKFLSSVSSSLGSVATMMLRTHMEIDKLPALVLIMRMRATTEIFTVINGNVGVNDLMSSLLQAVDLYSEQQRTEMREEDERAQREMIKIEQDQAFQQSLAVDREKEENKRLAAQMEKEEKDRVEAEERAIIRKKETHKRYLQTILPPEPESSGEGIITVRFRCPALPSIESSTSSGNATNSSTNVLCRKFSSDESVQNLINYLIIQGYHTEDYKVIFGWPRKELAGEICEKTLSELKFCAQETLMVEER